MGARATLTRYKPVVLLEWTPCLFESRPRQVEEMFEFFRDCGYVGSTPRSRAVFELRASGLWSLAPKGSSVNLILTPRGVGQPAPRGMMAVGSI